MNSTPPAPTEPLNQTDDSDDYKVAVHFAVPRKYPLLLDVHAADHPPMLRVLAAGLQMILSEANILRVGEDGTKTVWFYGDLTDGLMCYTTSERERKRAVELTRDLLELCGLLGFVEIAHADEEEGLFRLLYSTNPSGPFERYYDKGYLAARRSIMDRFFRLREDAVKSISPDTPL